MLHFHTNWTVLDQAKPEAVFQTEMEARGHLAAGVTSLANYLMTDELRTGDAAIVEQIADCLRIASAIMADGNWSTENRCEWKDVTDDVYRLDRCDKPSCPHQPLESRFGTFLDNVSPEDFNF